MNRIVLAVLSLCAVSSTLALAGVSQSTQPSPSPAVARPMVPAAANSILANPDAFMGQVVTLTAAVERVISATAFTVDQDAQRSADELLILVPVLNATLAPNSYVTVIGEVIRHEGRPAVRATSVLNAASVDLAKRQAPPMTPEEGAFDKVMKSINRSFGPMRQIVSAGGGENAAEHAATLKQGFTETEAFWKKRGKADAEKWSAEARAHAEALERAVTAGNWDEAKTAVSSIQQTCSSCHAAYRQRGDDGAYRIRGN